MTSGGSNYLMTTDETAEYLGIATGTLQREWRKWELPAYRVGRSIRFRIRDVEQWIEQHREAPTGGK